MQPVLQEAVFEPSVLQKENSIRDLIIIVLNHSHFWLQGILPAAY